MDHETFDVRGRWELDRGPQELAYDFWWHLGYDTMVTSEWGTPDMFENGLIPEKILGSEYGHRLHFWDLLKRRHVQEIDLTSWCSSYVRRTILPKPMGSWGSSCACKTSHRRYFCGTVTEAGGQ